jgi:hypothetical protein
MTKTRGFRNPKNWALRLNFVLLKTKIVRTKIEGFFKNKKVKKVGSYHTKL